MKISTQLMFDGAAEEAMNFYVALFPDSKVTSITRYGPGEQGREGTVKFAEFELMSVRYACIDSPIKHNFSFTPSFSIRVEFDDRAQFDAVCDGLTMGGDFLMPPANYTFSSWFAWVQDRFGVSWQLNLA